jgi:GH24 family phage-related lysozyme (muramidase)
MEEKEDWASRYEEYVLYALPDEEVDYAESPEMVSTAGLEMPEDKGVAENVGDYLGKLEQYGTEALKGTVGAYMPGEFERFAKAGIKLAFPDADEGRIESAWNALSEDPEAFSAEDFYQWFGESQGNLGPDAIEGARMTGEAFGLGNILKKGFGLVKDAVKPAAVAATMAASPMAQSAESPDFYNQLADQMETWHGGKPMPTKDAAEKATPVNQRSKDIGFGHKIQESEEQSGMIHGVQFKDEQGNYIELSREDAMTILEKDIESNVELARKSGWDDKLAKYGTSWEELDDKYRMALSSLAYNVGGNKAGAEWDKVLDAAAKQDLKKFAKELRRKNNKRYSAGMDNRVAKELYYAGLIESLSEVKSVLPLANANKAGIPA